MGEFRTPFLVFLEFVLFLVSQIDDITPALLDVFDFKHHLDEVNIPVLVEQLGVLEVHEEGAAAVADQVHLLLHAIGLAPDGSDALEHHAQFLDTVTHFVIQIRLLLVTLRLEVVVLHFGLDQQLSAEVLQVFLCLVHHCGVEVTQVHHLELLADQVVLTEVLLLLESVADYFEPVHLLFDVRCG